MNIESNENNLNEYEDLLKINVEKLIPLLTCKICHGIFRTPYTINACMHTFCKACIFKYFYQNAELSQCPTCNNSLGGKPLDTLVFDNSINTLINILFPEFEIIDKLNTEKMYEAFRNHEKALPGDPHTDKKNRPTISISLLPIKSDYNPLPKLNKNRISVPPSMTMKKLKEYVKIKLDGVNYQIDDSELEIFYQGKVLNDDWNFDNVEKIHSFPKDDKVIFSYGKKEEN
jgi:hypothetical protein